MTDETTTAVEPKPDTDNESTGLDEVLAHLDTEFPDEPDTPDEETPGDKPVDDASTDKDVPEQEEDAGEVTPTVDRALIERAVKAGLSLDDAESFTKGEVLEHIVERLEASTKPEESTETESGEEEEGDDDPLAGIPELDPEVYDEKIVAAINASKAAIQKQQEIIDGLKQEVATRVGSEGSWVDIEIAKLGKDYVDVFGEGNTADMPAGEQKIAREKLQRHITFAESEAKAEGTDIKKDEAFKAALASAFSDKQKSLRGAVRQKAAADRSKKAINRPRSIDGKFQSNKDKDDFGSEEDREADALEAVSAFFKDE